MAAPRLCRVRPATPSDAAAWARLRNALWTDEEDRHAEEIERFFAGTLEEPVAVLLAETAQGEMVGVVELSLRSDLRELPGQRTGYVEGLYVVPSARFQGVAMHLLRSSQEWSRQQGCCAFASDRDDRILIDRSFSKDARRPLL